MVFIPPNTLSSGAYTLPDAAHLLELPLPRLRSWIRGVKALSEENPKAESRRTPLGDFETKGKKKDRYFDFLTLIELFSIAQFREHGVSMPTLRKARQELGVRFETDHPFALQGLLTDKKRLLKEMGDQTLLELGSGGQTAFESLLEPFCHRLDFDVSTYLACRFFPMGKSAPIVVDPKHAFGRPVILGTNTTTEALAALIRGGEDPQDIANDFHLDPEAIREAWRFENRSAA